MTQEEKELLLKDLCARLPYGVKCRCDGNKQIYTFQYEYLSQFDDFPLYLRPMSSMTEEELDECVKYSGIRELECPQIETFEDRLLWAIKMFSTDYKSVDWLNAHHFDYRGLIEKGLALEAPEGMYK